MRDGGRADDNAGVGRQPPGQLQPCTEQDKLPSQGNRVPARGWYLVSYMNLVNNSISIIGLY